MEAQRGLRLLLWAREYAGGGTMIHLCRHILPGGKLCEQAAVKDTLFCRHHSAVKAALAKEEAAGGVTA